MENREIEGVYCEINENLQRFPEMYWEYLLGDWRAEDYSPNGAVQIKVVLNYLIVGTTKLILGEHGCQEYTTWGENTLNLNKSCKFK